VRVEAKSANVPSVINFANGALFKLSPANPQEIVPAIAPLLIPGEEIVSAYKAMRDFVVFTSRRLIAVNVQGMTGKKRDFTSLPYSKVQAYSIETAGTFDLDSELDLWFSGLGKVRLEFKGQVDIRQLGQMIAQYVL
jgi:Bacterial PH domain